MTFHPTWTVPTSIVRRDLHPKIHTDPNYFSRGDFLLTDATDGALIDPDVLPDLPLSAEMLRIMQLPGPDNALGKIRLEMPNRHAVFLHDTAAPELFHGQQRAHSSGCIRVQAIVELTRWLLTDHPLWDDERIDAVLDDTAQITVMLNEPVPVLLTYITAWAPEDGLPRFRQDIYELDTLPITTGP